MPGSAWASGNVDQVLPLAEIPAALAGSMRRSGTAAEHADAERVHSGIPF
jgi:chemotaxis response regulator CheB